MAETPFLVDTFCAMSSSGGQKDPEHEYFDELGTCIVKTSAMFVGELEFSDIPFRQVPFPHRGAKPCRLFLKLEAFADLF